MKNLIALSILAFGPTAQADAFKPGSPISSDLQNKIVAEVQAKCGSWVANNLSEIETKVESVAIDQGQVDFFYETTFVSSYLFDGTHPSKTYVTVKSEDLFIHNPVGAGLRVVSVESEACNN